MDLIGKAIAHYQIEASLGSGGMGEVYQARDTRLGRRVAVKVLPELFANDAERVARFDREARLLASLNHPNIAALYGLEESGGKQLLVMELVEGETLAEQIQRGPIPVQEALKIGHQIAEAFEAAHEKGIIHRDLKPANVKITPEGQVKVLDFGLAKALDVTPTPVSSNSPTLLSPVHSNAGVILGTAGYMSPEQARGHNADQRSDIFSFGCVLYEMLTGRQTFPGETVTDIIASLVARDPDFGALPANLNPKAQDLIGRCLAKNRRDRWHAMGDLRFELETILGDPHGQKLRSSSGIESRPLWKRAIPVVVTALLVAGTALIMWPTREPQAVTRIPIVLPDSEILASRGSSFITISPDGSNLVYAASDQLYLRPMEDMEARPITGTAHVAAHTPVFSPDGRSLAFFSSSERKFKRIAITGGASVDICPADSVYGASWDSEGEIFIGQGRAGILRCSSGGGKPETVVTVKPDEFAHGPQLLPGGDLLLFTLAKSSSASGWDTAQIVVESLKSGDRQVLFEGGSDARYAPTGHITYALGSTLRAVPFDIKNLRPTGSSMSLVEDVRRQTPGSSGEAQFHFSNNGTLVYVPGESVGAAQRVLALADQAGNRRLLNIPAGLHEHPRISPDGKQLAFHTNDGKETFVSIYDLDGSVPMRRLTFAGSNEKPVWTLDSKRVVFASRRPDDSGLFWQPADGGPPERLTQGPGQPEAWIPPDGKTFIYSVNTGGEWRLFMLPLPGDQRAKPLIEGWAANSSISPDGRWLAYNSLNLGRQEVYVQPIPPDGGIYQVSTKGGRNPLWSPDGTQLFYLQAEAGGTSQIVFVDIETKPRFRIRKTAPSPIKGIIGATGPRHYDVTLNGKQLQFVVMMPKSQADPDKAQRQQINVTLNWFEALKQAVPMN